MPTQTPKREPMAVTLPPHLIARVRQEADARMIAPSLIVERALDEFLPSMPPSYEPAKEEAGR